VNEGQQLRKAAERLRKTAQRVNRFDDRTLDWVPTLLPKRKSEKHHTYWVDEHSVSNSGGEGYRTVADCIWHVGDINYIAMMHPPMALILADLIDNTAGYFDEPCSYLPGSNVDHIVKLAKEINRQWKLRARRPKK